MIKLSTDRFSMLREAVKAVPFNNLFARSVIEKHVTGNIWVDNAENPQAFYVLHPYGMSLLFGESQNDHFNQDFKKYALNDGDVRQHPEWLQTYPREWDKIFDDLFGDLLIKASDKSIYGDTSIIELHTRVNFRFNRQKYLKRKIAVLQDEDIIAETDHSSFMKMTGTVIPGKFWDSAEDFMAYGKGFTLLHKGEIASTAYSAFIHEDRLEIGIETIDKFRGKGYAELTCCSLIDYCLENRMTPVWSCRLENAASFRLAEKLGFEQTFRLPFYRLSK